MAPDQATPGPEVPAEKNAGAIGGGVSTSEHAQKVRDLIDKTKAPNLNAATSITGEEIDDLMAYHKWDEAMIAKGEIVRNAIGVAVNAIIHNVPPGPDRSVALRKLREARMDANSAITHGGKY